jgi:hypothetical protein
VSPTPFFCVLAFSAIVSKTTACAVDTTQSRSTLVRSFCVNRGVDLPYDSRAPGNGSGKSDRALAGVFLLVLSLAFATALFASIYARGIFQDGVYYLYRIAERQWFHLVDPARTTVQALRQAPIVLLTLFSELSLFERGQVLTFVMLCAICWWIAPACRKGWIIFPILHLTVGFSATSFNAVGETAIATSFWWCMFFLLLFRTRDPASQTLFVVLCVLAFRLHEGAFPLMLVLLLACVIRLMSATARRERVFLTLSILLIVSITVYELRWVIDPRVPADRTQVLHGLANFEYIFHGGHLNLPLVTGTVAVFAIAGVMLIQWLLPGSSAPLRTRQLAISFCAFSIAAAAVSIFVETGFSPDAQVMARYHPVFVSFGLGLVMLGFSTWAIPERIWLQPATLVIISALCLVQTIADVTATLRWREYIADLQTRLTATRGLIRWEDTLVSGNPTRDANWRLMSIEWVIPLVCIVFAKNGLVTTMIDPRPEMTFRPVDPAKPDRLPAVRGIDFSPYRAALINK